MKISETYISAASYHRCYFSSALAWTGGEIFEDFNLLTDYLGIVIPLGISAAATSLMCLVSAKEAGDPFPVRESLIADGLGTCVASFFGSPFGTVIYVSQSSVLFCRLSVFRAPSQLLFSPCLL
jgi:hypothetical protein